MPKVELAKTSLAAGSLLVLAGCVSQSAYDDLSQKNQQLQQQVAEQQDQITAQQDEIGHLRGAIKYTVNSDLLFPSGGYQMSDRGKEIIGRLASKLAPNQQNKLYVYGFTDNTPIGPALQQQGIPTNEVLSQKRADEVMNYLISQGVKPDLVTAKGLGESNPIAPNDTPADRAKNRRVELTLEPIS